MKLKNKLEVEETLEVGVLPNAPANNFSVVFETAGLFQRRQVGNIINKNENDFLPSISNAFPTSVFAFNVSTTNANPNLTVSFVNQVAGTVFAAPQSLNGTPAFRMLQDSDLSQTSLGNKQNALTNGLHTTLNGNKVDVAFNDSTYVNDKLGNPRFYVSATNPATDMLFRLSQVDGNFRYHTASNTIIGSLQATTGWNLNVGNYSVGEQLPSALNRNMGTTGGWARNMMSISHSGTDLDVIGYYGVGSIINYGYLGGLAYNNKNAIRWSPNGFVGIGSVGTVVPTHPLQVITAQYEAISIQSVTANGGSAVRFANASNVTLGDIGFGVVSNDFTVRGATGLTLMRINQNNGVPYFPQLPAPQTLDANLAIIDSGNGLWKHNVKISDLVTTSNVSSYVPLQVNLTQGAGIGITGTYPNLTITNAAPNVQANNGLLTLATGAGLTGGVTFSADQATAANFTVGIASTHVLPTTAQVTAWNAKGNGTVTSVAMTSPTGLTVTGSPITTSGTLALTYASGYQGYTTTEATKLAGLNNYVLPNASATVLGGIKVGSNLSIDANGVLSATNTTYTAGTGLSLTGTVFGQTITTSGTGTFVTGITQTTNGFQVNLGTPPNTVYTAGTGISIASNVITNSAPNATHTGDVTGATALTIATSAVTFPKMQNIATQTFLGRATAGTGNVEALTATQVKTVLGIPDVIGNGIFTVQGTGALTGTGSTSANTNANTTATLDLTPVTKANIQAGVNANNIIPSIIEGVDVHYITTNTNYNIPIEKKKTIVNVSTGVLGAILNIDDGIYDGYELAINGCTEWSVELRGNIQNKCQDQGSVSHDSSALYWWSAEMGMWIQAI